MSSGTPEPTGQIVRRPADATAARRLEDYLRDPQQSTTPFFGGTRPVFDGVGLDFRGAILHGVDLSEGFMMRANFEGVDLSDCDLVGVDMTGASLTGAVFDRALLMDDDMAHVNAVGASFAEAECGGAEFLEADLRGAVFREANLGGVMFNACVLIDADLRGARLERTDFGQCRVQGMYVEGAYGTAIGPAEVDGGVQLEGDALTRWFRERGADVRIVPAKLGSSS